MLYSQSQGLINALSTPHAFKTSVFAMCIIIDKSSALTCLQSTYNSSDDSRVEKKTSYRSDIKHAGSIS